MADNETGGQNPSESTSRATVASSDGNDNGSRQQRTTTVSRSKEDLEDGNSSPSKKQRLEVEKEDYNLEERLNNILRCSRCQDLPSPTVYQCANGHLLCIGCLLELSAESRVQNTQATCPQPGCATSLKQCTRNLVIEKTVAELPITCPFCQKLMPRHELFNHKKECHKRPVQCKYSSIGCDWVGEFWSLDAHEAFCPCQTKTGRDLIDSVQQLDETKDKEMRMYKRLLELLSCEKVELIDFKLQPYRNISSPNDLCYDSRTFAAHDLSWMVHACVNYRQDPATGSVTRCLSYKLVLRSKPPTRFQVSYILVKGPGGMAVMDPMLYDFRFSEDAMETPLRDAPCRDPSDMNALLAAKSIDLRLALIQVKK